MSSSATASNIKTGIVQSNIEKSVVLMNDPAHGCTHRRTSNIVPTDIHRLSTVHCIHGYPWTVHGTLYPRISMDCPWYIVSTDIHGLSMVHCIHGYPWTVHGTLYPRISMDCPWYIVSTDIHGLSMVHCIRGYIHGLSMVHCIRGYIHGLSMVHCIHGCPWTVHGTLYPQISMDCPWYIVSTDIHGLSSTRTTYPRISMDCTTHPMGEMAGKVTREYNVPMDIHGLSAHPMGEMAGKVTQEYNVSMDIHGLSAHPMGEMAYSGIQCIHGYAWTVRAPHGEMAGKVTREYNVSMDIHGLSAHPMGEMAGKVTRYPWISMDCPPTPWGRWLESYSGIKCIHGYPWTVRPPWLEKLLGNTMYPWISMDIHGLSTHPMGELLIPWVSISVLPDLWI